MNKQYIRPKTRGELYDNLLKGIECEVVADNESITTTLLQSLCILGNNSTMQFGVKPSENIGWVVYYLISL